MFETGSYNLTAGSFSISANSALLAQTNNALAVALGANLSLFDQSAYSLAVSPPTGDHFSEGYQDYIIRTPAPVPEPSTLLLLGSGLIGLVALRNKKKPTG